MSKKLLENVAKAHSLIVLLHPSAKADGNKN